jgi:hypothetical protein
MVWAGLREAMGWDMSPMNMQDFMDRWVPLGG